MFTELPESISANQEIHTLIEKGSVNAGYGMRFAEDEFGENYYLLGIFPSNNKYIDGDWPSEGIYAFAKVVDGEIDEDSVIEGPAWEEDNYGHALKGSIDVTIRMESGKISWTIKGNRNAETGVQTFEGSYIDPEPLTDVSRIEFVPLGPNNASVYKNIKVSDLGADTSRLVADGKWGDMSWKIEDDNILTVEGGSGVAPVPTGAKAPWEAWKAQITAVRFGDETIASIGNNAFSNMNIADVYTKLSEAQWGDVAIGEGNEAIKSATMHFSGEEPGNSIRCAATEYGAAKASRSKAEENDIITLTALPKPGYKFDFWIALTKDGTEVPVEDNKFTMLNEEVFVVPAFAKADPKAITVTNDGNGTATASASEALVGDVITLTPYPNENFRLKEWQVISGGVTVDEDNTFVMGTEEVEIKAIFEPVINVKVGVATLQLPYSGDISGKVIAVLYTEAGNIVAIQSLDAAQNVTVDFGETEGSYATVFWFNGFDNIKPVSKKADVAYVPAVPF